MRYLFKGSGLLLLAAGVVFGQFGDPFSIDARRDGDVIRVDVDVPTNHYLYVESFKLTDALGNEQQALELPPASSIIDPNDGKPKPVFDRPFSALFARLSFS